MLKPGWVLMIILCAFVPARQEAFTPYDAVWHLSEEFAMDASWKPDGNGLAIVTNLGVYIVDAQYHQTQFIDLPPLVTIYDVYLEWSWDGRYLALSGFGESGENRLSVWDISTGEAIYSQSIGRIWDIAWRPNTNQIAIYASVEGGSSTMAVHLIDLENESTEVLPNLSGWIGWDTTGQTLYVGDIIQSGAAYDMNDGTTVPIAGDEVEHLSLRREGAQYHADGLRRALSFGIQDADTQELLQEFERGDARFQKWHPTRDILLFVSLDFVAAWEVSNNASTMLFDRAPLVIGDWIPPGNVPSNHFAWGPDGRYIALAQSGESELVVGIWDSATGTPIRVLHSEHGALGGARYHWISWNPVTNRLAATAPRTGLVVWDVDSGEIVSNMADIESWVVWSPDGSVLATDNSDGISLVHVGDGTRTWLDANIRGFSSGTFSPNGHYFAAATGHDYDYAVLWNVTTGEQVDLVKGYLVVALSDDHMATITEYTVQIRDITTGQPIHILENAPSGRVAWHPEGRYLATASSDSIAIFDAQTGERLQSMVLPDYITSIAFSPDGKRLAAASVGYGVTIWEQQP